MTKVLEEMRLQDQNILAEEMEKMEKRLAFFGKETRFASRKILLKAQEKMQTYFATGEEGLAGKETEMNRKGKIATQEMSLKDKFLNSVKEKHDLH